MSVRLWKRIYRGGKPFRILQRVKEEPSTLVELAQFLPCDKRELSDLLTRLYHQRKVTRFGVRGRYVYGPPLPAGARNPADKVIIRAL